MDELLDERSLSKLRWRCRRGLLENDLFVQRFFQQYDTTLSVRQSQGLLTLMDLPDNDLLDLLLGRKPLAGEVDTPEAREVLAQLRSAPVPHPAKHAL
jgi:antitoxin CptB